MEPRSPNVSGGACASANVEFFCHLVLPMPFQFYCPAGHLLMGDESLGGQVCACPTCGATFVMPQAGPPAEPPSPWATDEPPPPPGSQPATPPPPSEPPTIQLEIEPPLHIRCPAGHTLETPHDMLGQEALCPFCNVRFRLRREDSAEYRQELERREEEMGVKWMRAAIVAAVVVLGAVIFLIGMMISRG